MKLSSVKLENYRLFSDLECTLHPELTVIVATNGSGKTSLLDGIRVMFDAYLGAFPTGKGSGIKAADVRLIIKDKSEFLRMESVYPTRVTAYGELPTHTGVSTWTRALNTPKSKTTIKEARVLREYAQSLQVAEGVPNDKTLWPLLAYYGTGRLWSQKKWTSNKQFTAGYYSRAAGYIDCMDPASSHKSFIEWFGSAYRANTSAKIRFMESTPDASAQDVLQFSSVTTPLLNAVREAVDIVLAPSEWNSIWYSDTLADATMAHPSFGRLAVGQLSDGIRNTIGLVADIAYRAVQLNGCHLGELSAKETCGVVLIDEIDMHLHPQWQQLILENLNKAFPRIQFIVTTHSPQVLTTVKPECIRSLQWNGKEIVVRDNYEFSEGAEAQVLLEEILGTNSRPQARPVVQRLNQYLDLVAGDKWDTNEAKELRRELDEWGHGHETALLNADIDIRVRQYRRDKGRA